MAALTNMFNKHYKKKTNEWFNEFIAKTKDGSLDDIAFVVKKLVESGSWASFYNSYFGNKVDELTDGFVGLVQYYELNHGNIDMQSLLEKQLSFLSDIKELEETIKDTITILYYASEIGYLYVKVTNINDDVKSISSFFNKIKVVIEQKCDKRKVSDKSFSFHSLNLSLHKSLNTNISKHITELRSTIPLESFDYNKISENLLLPAKILDILNHKRAFSLNIISNYVKDKLIDRHNHLTNKQYLDLKTGLKHPVIDSMFSYLQNLNLNRNDMHQIFHSGCENVFSSIHHKINEIYTQSATNKELNKELANYCWVSFTFIYELQAQIDQINREISLETTFIELKNELSLNSKPKLKNNKLYELSENFTSLSLTGLNNLVSLYQDFDTQKNYLSKRLFECFQRHLSSTTADKKLQFLKFFGAPDMRKTFKNILAYLTDRSINNLLFAITSLLSHSYVDKSKELLNKEIVSIGELEEYLKAENLTSYLKYL